MPNSSIQCGDCGAILDETMDQVERSPCPTCGSTRRCINVSVTEEVAIMDQFKMKVVDPNRTGKDKIKIEQLVGDDLHRKSGKWNKKVRVIDRANDRYFEEVVDRETGEVIHHCEEPLSEHFGHGSAKDTEK